MEFWGLLEFLEFLDFLFFMNYVYFFFDFFCKRIVFETNCFRAVCKDAQNFRNILFSIEHSMFLRFSVFFMIRFVGLFI